jgi:hypothetical protein
MPAAAGPLRSGEALRSALEQLGPAAAGLAALVLRSALLREESRGAHVRTDHPAEDPPWADLEVVARPGGEVTVRRRANRPSPLAGEVVRSRTRGGVGR